MFENLKLTHQFVSAVLCGDVVASVEAMAREGRKRGAAWAVCSSNWEQPEEYIADLDRSFDSHYVDQLREIGATDPHIAEMKRAFIDALHDATRKLVA